MHLLILDDDDFQDDSFEIINFSNGFEGWRAV